MPEKLTVKGYVHVNDETGRIMLNQQGFNVSGRKCWVATVWTDRQSAQLNCDGGDRVVRVAITEID